MQTDPYPPLADYAYIADCHSAALVSKSGSIDWCCMPRIDSASCFGRLLGWAAGGYCQIVPSRPYTISRRYLDRTLILETTFTTEDGGAARLIDFFPMQEGGEHHPLQQILRIIQGIRGRVSFRLDIEPRFDYGAVKPWIRQSGNDFFIAIGGNNGLMISGDLPLMMKHRHNVEGTCTIEAGEKRYLSILSRHSEDLDEERVPVPEVREMDRSLVDTIAWWRSWAAKGKIRGPYAKYLWRSAIVLKALSNAPTGAIAAAATTSLPEAPGGERNWDYRYTWIRDSCFTVRSLTALGFHSEADGFRRFVERSSAGSSEELQILFGVGGERRLTEVTLENLEGYRGARPIRIGNAAERQRQLDVYGELLDLAWRWHTLGRSPDDDYWEFVTELVNSAVRLWRRPDQGIWEMRGPPRHFVQSKAMCWAAVDRGIKLAEDLGRKAPVDLWKTVRDDISRTILEKGYDADRGTFIQAFDHPVMDSSLLLLPTIGFVDYRDERMIRTTDSVWRELGENGFLRRYAADNDGMAGKEGAFLACSFWLVECLAFQGRIEEAHTVFEHATTAGNDLLLFSEEYNTDSLEMLGNFPQGLTHLSLIAAAVALTDVEGDESG